MLRIFSSLAGAAVAATLLSSPARAPPSSAAAELADFKNMTVRQWQKLEAKFAREHVRWKRCESQATDLKIPGHRARWSFLYDCMTK
jgi:hypothetical protein